jgi:hypothetical protein
MPFHDRSQRWAVNVIHRRAGKTTAIINDMIKRAIACPFPDGRYAYVAPFLSQAKDIAWSYLKRDAAPLLAGPPNESELRVDLRNGARIRLYGADNRDRLRGIYLDGVALDEYADIAPAVFGEIVRPMLADRKGWAVFAGTPKGRNHLFDIYQRASTDAEWFTSLIRASESRILDPEELESLTRDQTPEQYAQELECSFEAALIGAYYAKEMVAAQAEGRISEVASDPELPIHRAWDLGIGDSTAIWFFQVVGKEIHVVDHYESSGFGLDHYAAIIKQKIGNFRSGTDFVPHDARARELGTGRTRVETLMSLGLEPRIIPDHKPMDGINAARLTIPRCYFDEQKCYMGLEMLRRYRQAYDKKLKIFRDYPQHDEASHTADAFRYLAVAWREIVAAPPIKDTSPRGIENITYGELMAKKNDRKPFI